MAEETKIEMKLEKELEPIKEMCKPLEEAVKHELSRGIENVYTKELGEVVDMIKDLYEAKEKIVKACYYKSVIQAMEEHDFEDEEDIMDEGRRGYRGQPRSKTSGRFMSRGDGRRSNGRRGYENSMMMYDEDWEEMERMRDADRPYGRMGYSGNNSNMGGSSSGGMNSGSMGSQSGSRGYSQGNEGGQYSSRNQQTSRSENARRGYEETKMMQDGSPESKKKAMESLENYMKELGEDMTELVGKMDANEKSMLKAKLQTLAQKVS